jgi:hypothetical protein
MTLAVGVARTLETTYTNSGYRMKLTHRAEKILSLTLVLVATMVALSETWSRPHAGVFFAWGWVLILSLSAWAVFLKRQ